jgi:hypothetical protein
VAHVDAVAGTTGPGTGRPGAGGRGPSWRRWRLLVLLAVLAVGLVAIWSTGVHDLVRPERIAVLRQWVDATMDRAARARAAHRPASIVIGLATMRTGCLTAIDYTGSGEGRVPWLAWEGRR